MGTLQGWMPHVVNSRDVRQNNQLGYNVKKEGNTMIDVNKPVTNPSLVESIKIMNENNTKKNQDKVITR